MAAYKSVKLVERVQIPYATLGGVTDVVRCLAANQDYFGSIPDATFHEDMV